MTNNYKFEFLKKTPTITNEEIQLPEISFKDIAMNKKKINLQINNKLKKIQKII
jgi:hypothetical protein